MTHLIWQYGRSKIFVGGCDSAVGWAAEHLPVIVNCADVDYEWAPTCPRRWLNLNFKGDLNGRT